MLVAWRVWRGEQWMERTKSSSSIWSLEELSERSESIWDFRGHLHYCQVPGFWKGCTTYLACLGRRVVPHMYATPTIPIDSWEGISIIELHPKQDEENNNNNNNNNNKSFQKAKNTQPEDWENVGAILSTLIRLAFGAMDLDPCLPCFTLMICPSWERIHIPKTFGTFEFGDFPYFLFPRWDMRIPWNVHSKRLKKTTKGPTQDANLSIIIASSIFNTSCSLFGVPLPEPFIAWDSETFCSTGWKRLKWKILQWNLSRCLEHMTVWSWWCHTLWVENL